MKYQFTHKEACCIRDYVLESLETIHPTAEGLLAAAVAAEYAIKLSRRLVFYFSKKRAFTLPPKEALALWIISKGKSIQNFTEFETGVVLPILQDIERNLKNAKA